MGGWRGPPAPATGGAPDEVAEPTAPRAAPLGFVLGAAAAVGFAFFLMELVWYRMLAPILGGTSYTFGMILAVALAGIGAGGLVYSAGRRSRRPTLVGFGVTCALEALFLILPFALGDRLAVLALGIQGLDASGFGGLVLEWVLVTVLVVFPAALVSGYQFPLLVGVLGSGRRAVGREVGLAYAWNTVGAIGGAVAGGFGLLPLLTAPGTWRWTAIGLSLLALAAAVVARVRGDGRGAGRRGRLVGGTAASDRGRWRSGDRDLRRCQPRPVGRRGADRVLASRRHRRPADAANVQRPERSPFHGPATTQPVDLGGGGGGEQHRAAPGGRATPSWSTARPTAARSVTLRPR